MFEQQPIPQKKWPLRPSRRATLGDELEGFLRRKAATADLSDRGKEWYTQSTKAWHPFWRRSVSSLCRREIEDYVISRAEHSPVAARNELQVLKACLRAARSRGQRVDRGILDIPAIRHRPREGRALTLEELYAFSSYLPNYIRRIIPLAGLVGARQRVWFELTEDLVDFDRQHMRIPSALSKNRRPQHVTLIPTEIELLREQLAAREADTHLVFPTKQGHKWNRHHFRDRVWVRAVGAAGLEGFTFHMLRHTAASLMAFAGMDPAVAAARLGHSDGGALFLRRYRHLYETESQRQVALLEAFVRRERCRWSRDPSGGEAMGAGGIEPPTSRV